MKSKTPDWKDVFSEFASFVAPAVVDAVTKNLVAKGFEIPRDPREIGAAARREANDILQRRFGRSTEAKAEEKTEEEPTT